MKKTLLSPVLLSLLSLPAMAQLPVSQTAQNRKVVLEEFTGITCVFCPDGHRRANDLQESKPAGDVVLINIHTGGFAIPSGGAPDFRTTEGAAIAAIPNMNITGYPTGSINRRLFAGETGYSLSRNQWASFADSILAMPSYVNVALEGDLNVSTRLLTVNTQVYFTANSPVSNNRLTVMLLEDGVSGPQTGSSDFYATQIGPDGKYIHNHMLRKVLTGSPLGEVLTTNSSGTTINKTYTYTVPAQYLNNDGTLLGNLQIIAFVAEGDNNIVTGAYGPITLNNFPATNDSKVTSLLFADKEICAQVNSKVRLYNGGSTAITTAVFKASVNGNAPVNVTYTGSIDPQSQAFIEVPPVPAGTVNATNNLEVQLLSVNGTALANQANLTRTAILGTSRKATGDSVKMLFTQDAFGSESTWKIVQEGTNQVVLSGGPYADLGQLGTVLHEASFMAQANRCFEVIVSDSYGDGINSGAGAGKFEIVSDGQTIYTSTGNFGTRDRITFKSRTDLSVGSLPHFASSVSLAPNPATTGSKLTLSLERGTKLSVQVMDMTGRMVNQIAEQNLSAGTHHFDIATDNLAAGVYNVRIATAEGVVTQRLSVVK